MLYFIAIGVTGIQVQFSLEHFIDDIKLGVGGLKWSGFENKGGGGQPVKGSKLASVWYKTGRG